MFYFLSRFVTLHGNATITCARSRREDKRSLSYRNSYLKKKKNEVCVNFFHVLKQKNKRNLKTRHTQLMNK